MSVSKSRVRLSLEYILTLKKAWVCVRVRVNANSQSLFSFRLDMYYRNRIYFLSLTTCVCFNSYSRSFSLDMLVYVCIHMCAPTPSLLPIVMYCFTSSSSSVSPFPLTLLPLLWYYVPNPYISSFVAVICVPPPHYYFCLLGLDILAIIYVPLHLVFFNWLL